MTNSYLTTGSPHPSTIKRLDWLDAVLQNVNGIRYGSVLVTVHEGKVTQVETSTKTRFDSPPEPVHRAK